jgi:predicted dehydrogenase
MTAHAPVATAASNAGLQEHRRLRVGVVGTGLVAQVMHLPNLRELEDRYEIRAICDASETAASACAARYGVPRVHTDWKRLLDEELEAVLVLTSGSHVPIAIAAAASGRHVFLEKPLAYSVSEGKELLDAVKRSGVTLMVGYPKRYDPAYLATLERVRSMQDLRFVRMTTMESPLAPYVAHYPLVRGDDVGADLIAEWRTDSDQRVRAAIGDLGDLERRTYEYVLLDSLVHEFNLLRGVLGEPSALEFASIRSASVNLVLDFSGIECALAWIDLPGIAAYEMEARFFDPDERVRLSFPSPFLRNMPTILEREVGEQGGSRSSVVREVASYEEPFKLELVEFHRAVVEGGEPLTSGLDALRDVALCQSVITSAVEQRPIADPSALTNSGRW